MHKINELLELIGKDGIDAVIITDPYNLRYYSGFSGREGCLYISRNRNMLITDSRYTLWAKKECGEESVYIAGDGGKDILKKFAKEDKVSRLGLEGNHLTWKEYNKYSGLFEGVDIVSVEDATDSLRMIKSSDEIEKIASAEAIGDAAFEYILGILRPGLNEREVALELEMFMRRNGAEGLSFDVIAASGLNSASPHAMPSDKKLGSGEFLTMDFGCIYEGYCSDMTRTVVIGKADEKMRQLYNIVLQAQNAAIDRLRAGITGSAGDAYGRDVIKEAGYGDHFGHGLGHSVGLYIHESPRLSPKETAVLKPGMVLTVEPGIYVEGFGGVRIEDVVVIEQDGVRNLTSSPKELIEV